MSCVYLCHWEMIVFFSIPTLHLDRNLLIFKSNFISEKQKYRENNSRRVGWCKLNLFTITCRSLFSSLHVLSRFLEVQLKNLLSILMLLPRVIYNWSGRRQPGCDHSTDSNHELECLRIVCFVLALFHFEFCEVSLVRQILRNWIEMSWIQVNLLNWLRLASSACKQMCFTFFLIVTIRLEVAIVSNFEARASRKS